jgi:hypothetical protein
VEVLRWGAGPAPHRESIAGVDTIAVISFDSFRTAQVASEMEVEAIRRFLDNPDHLIFVCPHHKKARPHPFTLNGRTNFDALQQSRPSIFAGRLLVCDTTMFSSTAGGFGNLRQLWSNVLLRPRRP